MPHAPVLHAVTNDEIVARPDFLARADSVMRAIGERGAVQLRAPALGGRRLYALARALAEGQRRTGCWLVVTDRVDVALAAGARGVQLTSRSMSVADARRFASALAVGASVQSTAEACAAADDGATWTVVSSVLDSIAHPSAPASPESGFGGPQHPGLARLSQVGRAVSIPVIAIGGILPRHVAALRAAGAAGVAVIRGIWEASDAERAATDYLSAHDAHRVP
jgi:thiamine-phosphate diphosphorylase